jgi:hypothetical protein
MTSMSRFGSKQAMHTVTRKQELCESSLKLLLLSIPSIPKLLAKFEPAQSSSQNVGRVLPPFQTIYQTPQPTIGFIRFPPVISPEEKRVG